MIKLTHPSIAMLALVIWNTAEFAMQPNKRPIDTEAGILVLTIGILLTAFFGIALAEKWPFKLGLLLCTIHLAFAVFGIMVSPPNEGFGKVGPGVSSVLLLISIIFSYWEIRGFKLPD